jgi:hypothetical protein
MLFRRGLNAKQVQAWLGHHSPAFTLSVYVHLLADDLPEVSILDSLSGGNAGATEPTEITRNGIGGDSRETGLVPTRPSLAEAAEAVF